MNAATMLTFLATLSGSASAGDQAPDITGLALSGAPVQLSELRGRVVLVDFWATWCAPCRRSLPHHDKLQRRYADQGLVVLAVSIDDDRTNVTEFVRRLGLSMMVVHDLAKLFVERYEPPKMPTAYLIDARGVIQSVYVGYSDGDEARIEADLRRLLPPRPAESRH